MRPRLSAAGAALGAILLLAAALRLLYITAPLLDAHRWRQVDTAAIARNMYRHDLNPFYPEVDWGGRRGYVECEFPLVPFIAAVAYKAWGIHEWLGRLISVVFSVGAVFALYRLGLVLLGPAGARAAAFLLAISPGAVFFGRTFMPDAAMLCFSITAVLGVVEYSRSGRIGWLVLGSVSAGLAWLVKLPAIVMLPVLGAAAWEARRWRALRDPALLLALAAPLVVSAAWYYHAWRIFRATGLTFGLLVHPAKTYPREVWHGPWDTLFSKWTTWQMLESGQLASEIFERLYFLHLLPWGFALAVVGMVIWRRRAGVLTTWTWVGTMLAFILVAGGGHLAHDYYQLPLVPAAALFFGAAAAPIFDGEWLARRVGSGWRGPVLAGAAVTLVGLVSFYYSGVIQSHFRPQSLDVRLRDAGAAIDRVTPDESLAIVVDDYGITSPLLLYYANLQGWSFDLRHIEPTLIAWLGQRGARFFATTNWPRLRERRPEAASVLERFERVPLQGAPAATALFDLTKPR